MTVRVGINGFGRIGRNFFRALAAAGADIEIVAVNDLGDNDDHGAPAQVRQHPRPLPGRGRATDDGITVGGKDIKILAERDPANLPWGDLGVDVVIESTGFFTKAADARKHVDAGAKKVIISAPATDEDVTIVMGVNDDDYDAGQAHDHLQRVVHHELPRPAGQGARRRVRHRARPDDDDPRLHAGPEPAGRPAQGPAPGPRRRAEHRADLHRCGEGDRPGAARAQGQARRLRAARAGPDRLGHRPHRHRRHARPASTRSRPPTRPRPTARSRASSPTPRTRSSAPTSSPTRRRASSTPG